MLDVFVHHWPSFSIRHHTIHLGRKDVSKNGTKQVRKDGRNVEERKEIKKRKEASNRIDSISLNRVCQATSLTVEFYVLNCFKVSHHVWTCALWSCFMARTSSRTASSTGSFGYLAWARRGTAFCEKLWYEIFRLRPPMVAALLPFPWNQRWWLTQDRLAHAPTIRRESTPTY